MLQNISDGADLNNLSIDINSTSNFNFRQINFEAFFDAFNKIKSNAVSDDGISKISYSWQREFNYFYFQFLWLKMAYV